MTAAPLDFLERSTNTVPDLRAAIPMTGHFAKSARLTIRPPKFSSMMPMSIVRPVIGDDQTTARGRRANPLDFSTNPEQSQQRATPAARPNIANVIAIFFTCGGVCGEIEREHRRRDADEASEACRLSRALRNHRVTRAFASRTKLLRSICGSVPRFCHVVRSMRPECATS